MFKQKGKEIAEYIMNTESAPPGWFHISGLRVIVSGTSGSGKTRAIDHANKLLPEHAQVAESSMASNVVRGESIEELLAKVKDPGLEYSGCPNIAFSMTRREVAQELARLANLPVFHLG